MVTIRSPQSVGDWISSPLVYMLFSDGRPTQVYKRLLNVGPPNGTLAQLINVFHSLEHPYALVLWLDFSFPGHPLEKHPSPTFPAAVVIRGDVAVSVLPGLLKLGFSTGRSHSLCSSILPLHQCATSIIVSLPLFWHLHAVKAREEKATSAKTKSPLWSGVMPTSKLVDLLCFSSTETADMPQMVPITCAHETGLNRLSDAGPFAFVCPVSAPALNPPFIFILFILSTVILDHAQQLLKSLLFIEGSSLMALYPKPRHLKLEFHSKCLIKNTGKRQIKWKSIMRLKGQCDTWTV